MGCFREKTPHLLINHCIISGFLYYICSISFYMRTLHATYNRVVEKELFIWRFPFKHVYTGIEKTTKRAVPLHVIKHSGH